MMSCSPKQLCATPERHPVLGRCRVPGQIAGQVAKPLFDLGGCRSNRLSRLIRLRSCVRHTVDDMRHPSAQALSGDDGTETNREEFEAEREEAGEHGGNRQERTGGTHGTASSRRWR
jgi:hypothetical protein